eukprot:gene22289-23400_t
MTSEQRQYQHIDPSMLLDAAGNDIEVFLNLSATFLDIVPPMFMRLQAAIDCGNMQAVTLESHSLKSTFVLVGAKQTATLLSRIEALSHSATIDDIKPMMAELTTLCTASQAEVRDSIIHFKAKIDRAS